MLLFLWISLWKKTSEKIQKYQKLTKKSFIHSVSSSSGPMEASCSSIRFCKWLLQEDVLQKVPILQGAAAWHFQDCKGHKLLLFFSEASCSDLHLWCKLHAGNNKNKARLLWRYSPRLHIIARNRFNISGNARVFGRQIYEYLHAPMH